MIKFLKSFKNFKDFHKILNFNIQIIISKDVHLSVCKVLFIPKIAVSVKVS